MTAVCAYRSSHLDVIVWWDAIEKDRAEFGRVCNEVRDRFPGYHPVVTEGRRGGSLVGIRRNDEILDVAEPPSESWRPNTRGGFLHYVPYKNHRKDPELVHLFSTTRWEIPRPWPGNMPDEVWVDGGKVWTPGIRHADGALWVTWGIAAEYVNPDDGFRERQMMFANREHVDFDVWEPAKLSVYYAAIGE